MRLEIIRGGGLAGLVSRTELDSADLPAPDAERLAALCRAAELAEPGGTSASPAAADALLYEITLDDTAGRRTARYSDATLPPPAQALVEFVDGRPERTTSVAPP